MPTLTRITQDTNVMGGRPCIRGLRVTVSAVLGLRAAGHSVTELIEAYPFLDDADVREALTYAAWRISEQEVALRRFE